MTIEEIILSILESDTQLAAIVGKRMYPDVAPTDAQLPCLIYELSIDEIGSAMDGPTGYQRSILQITVFARRDNAGKTVAIAARKRILSLLQNYKTLAPVLGRPYIQGIFYSDHDSGYDMDLKAYYEALDFEIHNN